MELVLKEQRLEIMPEGAAWWPNEAALLIADLHLGKDQVFRRHGMAVPASVLDGELERLDLLLGQRPARRLIVLGDLVHAPPETGEEWPEVVKQWRQRHGAIDIGVVLGNHDRALSSWLNEWAIEDLGGRQVLSGLELVHETDLDAPCPGLSGHLHPVARLRAGPDRVRLPVFAHRENHLILPAFGRFTGGCDLGRDKRWRCLAAAGHRVVPVG